MARKSRNSILRPRKLEGLFESLSNEADEAAADDRSEDVACVDSDNDVGTGTKRKRQSNVPGKMEVFLRIRPTPEEGFPECIHATGPNSIAISAPEGHMGTKNAERSHIFAFSKVLQADTTNKQLFAKQFAQRVNNALFPTRESLVVFAYGITATGKTHSMEGNPENPGVIPQTLQLLFHNRSNEEQVSMSMYEIYNENIYDMLTYKASGGNNNGSKALNLKLKEDGSGQIWIPGLSQKIVESAEEARQVLSNGLDHRKHAATGMNKRSSRSHLVVMVNITDANTNQWQSSVSFVDLAGSERQLRTGNAGLRLKESVAINSSLMTLGRCLEALRWNHDNKQKRKRHIPFRQAKITHAFKNAFLGSGSTVLLVNVSASAKDYEETVHVLKYASLATALPCSARPKTAIMNVEPAAKRQKEDTSAPPAAATNNNSNNQRRKDKEVPSVSEAWASPEEGEANAAELLEEQEELAEELAGEVERLKGELFESERRAAEMEARIREEVADEMSELLREMEHSYHIRLEAEVSAAKNAASTVENTNATGLQDEIRGLKEALKETELDLENARREIEAIQDANQESEQNLVGSYESLLEEEKTQLQANAAMEKETLEAQLEGQRQENEALRTRLKRMKDATRATLRKYNENLSPGPVALSNFIEESEKELLPQMEQEQEQENECAEAGRPGEYDVDTSDFVIKSTTSGPSAASLAKENVAAPDQKPTAQAKKTKGRKQSRKAKAALTAATPVARRTRAGRRACTAIENVQ